MSHYQSVFKHTWKLVRGKIIIISSLLLVILAVGIWMTQAQKCRVVNNSEYHKYDRTFTALTAESACQKAYAMCSYYSADIKNCRIINK